MPLVRDCQWLASAANSFLALDTIVTRVISGVPVRRITKCINFCVCECWSVLCHKFQEKRVRRRPPPVLGYCYRSSEAVLGGIAYGRNFMQQQDERTSPSLATSFLSYLLIRCSYTLGACQTMSESRNIWITGVRASCCVFTHSRMASRIPTNGINLKSTNEYILLHHQEISGIVFW